MEDTYTYIARSESNPAHVATFTLYDSTLSVGTGPALENVQRIAQSGEQGGSSLALKPILKPAAIRLMRSAGQRFDIADVDAHTTDGSLLVRIWTRVAGLRLAPITFKWEAVDNREAADSFVVEVERRKQESSNPGWFTGLLDYWITWIIGGVLLVWLIRNQLRDDS
jgi:hypothetical protein